MKYTIIAISIIGSTIVSVPSYAQLVKTQEKKQTDWYNNSFEKDGIYGAGVNQAYEFLKDKKQLKQPIVVVIGPGMDIKHEDLKGSIWINPKEKINLKDDDKNGWIDDIHGWNFLGTKDGKSLDVTCSFGDMEYLRLKDKYGGVVFDGKKYFRYSDAKEMLESIDPPKDIAEYRYFRDEVIPQSNIGRVESGATIVKYTMQYLKKFDQEMKQKFPHIKEFTNKEFATMYDKKAPRDSLREVAFSLTGVAFGVLKTEKWNAVYSYMLRVPLKSAQQNVERFYKKNNVNERQQIGDNPYTLEQKKYGNDNLFSENVGIGTLCAGIIGSIRDNGLGINGIASGARIMPLRVVGTTGDPYLKDVALAIRYAVDQKADVILLSSSNTLYPKEQGQWIDDALTYAESKGVLVIMPVKDMSYNLAKTRFFPNKQLSSGKTLTNLLTVAASDSKGNPAVLANYGKAELDVFAPGQALKSTFTGNTYREASGSLIGAATATGVAALIKSYYPNLSGSQIRSLLINNVTSRKGEEVEKSIRNMKEGKESHTVKDLYLFEDLCVSGGIINAEKAIKAAANLQKTK